MIPVDECKRILATETDEERLATAVHWLAEQGERAAVLEQLDSPHQRVRWQALVNTRCMRATEALGKLYHLQLHSDPTSRKLADRAIQSIINFLDEQGIEGKC